MSLARRNTIFTWVLLLLPVAVSVVTGQEQPSALPGIFGEVLDVRVVNIEVVVSDKSGVAVRGLSTDDFRLLVDGEEVPISFFSEIRSGVAIEPGADAEEIVPGVPTLAAGAPVGTSYLLFVDEFFSIGPDRDRVLDGIAAELDFMAPEDRMAVVAYNGRDLEMLTTWSQSPDAVRKVLRDAKMRRTMGLQRLSERRQFEVAELPGADILDFSSDGAAFNRTLNLQERAYIERLTEQLNRSVAAATATLRSFAKPPGRKVLLLLSGGWPFVPADYLVGDLSRLIVERGGPMGGNLYKRLSETANLLGYTLYPFDVPGFDRDFPGAAQAEIGDVAGFDNSFFQEAQVHHTLQFLAKETGGKALINNSRIGAFKTVVSDTRSYYWLGFSPTREWDDRQHEIEVETNVPGLRVRSRSGYLDISRTREVNMAVESSLLFGNSPGHGSLLVEAGPPEEQGRKRMVVPLKVLIPLDQVTFLPIDDTYATELELRIAVVDDDGHQAEMPVIPLRLLAPEDPSAGSFGSYETSLMLRRKPHRAVIALYDPASGRILSTGLDVEPESKRRRRP